MDTDKNLKNNNFREKAEEISKDNSYPINDLSKSAIHELRINQIELELHQAEERAKELELANNYNRSLIETSLDPLVTIEADGSIKDVNLATETITGYSRDELIGTNFSKYFTEPKKAQEIYLKIFDSRILHDYQLEIKNKNGHITPVLYNVSVLKEASGKVIGAFAAARDITQLKKSELELKKSKESLEEKVKERTKALERSNVELENFAYIASHDLKEPLRTITSFLQLLERRYKDQLDQDANEFIEYAVHGAKLLNDMINDLLEYSKVTHNELIIEPVNLEKVLDNLLHIMEIEEKKVIVDYDPLPIVNGNEQLLTMVLKNLIGNGIKYNDKKPPKIHISSKKDDNRYIISVKDNGIGIKPEYLSNIFKIFKRLHGNEYEGTGIGLTIAQKIVHQHHGEIWAESKPGQGTTFYFTIPTN